MGNNITGETMNLFNEQQIRQLQHEIKTHIQQFSKTNVGKGSDYIKCSIYDDMLILRGSGFLSEMELYISQTPKGCEKIIASRIEVIERSHQEFKEYLEEKFGAKEIHRAYSIEPSTNFWIDIHLFDRKFTKNVLAV